MGGRAASSFGAGKTYDGSATHAGGAIGPDSGAIGMEGVGDGAGAQSKTMAANADTKDGEAPPQAESTAKEVTPWATEIMVGMALGAVAVGLLLWATSMIKSAQATFVAAATTLALAGPAMVVFEKAMTLVKWVIGGAIALALAGVAMGR